ncbi:MAG: bifunctional metallophosphatase/5'-nucleotidase [Burkholderiales bacterium]|jgi:5'-nucleotidase|nr:bifunctional metallophosphatase/5'-nucleotidase [Burkholderiales bacterium]
MQISLQQRFAVLLCSLALGPLLPTVAHAQIPLRIIAINDLHGHLEPGENTIGVPHPQDATRIVPLRTGGAAFLATRVNALRKDAPASVFVSTGDLIGASPLVSALFRDEPTVQAMNAMGLDLNAAGNHEFDHGVQELQRMVGGGCARTPRGATQSCANGRGSYEGMRFALLAANVVDEAGQPLFAPHKIRSVQGVNVGFIGAVTRSTPRIVMPSGIRGLRFEREAAAVNRSVQALRTQGVNAFVAVIHEGGDTDGHFNECANPRGEIFEIARELDPAVRVVLSGHTHRGYVCEIDGRVIIQGASFGRLVSVVDLRLDARSGSIRPEIRAINVTVPNGLDAALDPVVRAAHPALAPDPVVAGLVADHRERAAPLADTSAGRITAAFTRQPDAGGDHAAGRLIADAHLAATRDNGAQIAFTNPGGVRSDLRPRGPDGRVTYGDLFTMQPFGNSLVTMTLTGAQLKTLLEDQWSRSNPDRLRFLQPSRGLTYAWRADRPHGHRIDPDSIRLAGERIRPEQSVRVTVNRYLAEGGDGFSVLREGRDHAGGPLDVDALTAHLRQQSKAGPIAPDLTPRIRRLD